jgi:hypothetical protein
METSDKEKKVINEFVMSPFQVSESEEGSCADRWPPMIPNK